MNEVFFDDVKVPVENLVHEEGKGWTVAKYLLGHERMNTGRIGDIEARARAAEGSSRAQTMMAAIETAFATGSRASRSS